MGSELARALAPDYHVVGMTRSTTIKPPEPTDAIQEWRSCDLFSLKDAENALEGMDAAYYLVHSMMPAAGLTQGTFENLDLIAADNFARAAKSRGVKQIIYLGGLIPPNVDLSKHLASRLEVEETLSQHGPALTALRAGVVVGPSGSSFLLLLRLIKRLPVMICPKWMEMKTQPVALADAVNLLKFCLGNERTLNRAWDIGSPDVLSYNEMIREIAQVLNRKLIQIHFPYFSTVLSSLWVSLVSGAPRSLVHPLIQSLNHEMVARDRDLQKMAGIPGIPFRDSVRTALAGVSKTPVAFKGTPKTEENHVRSVQRLPLPPGRNADWVAREYLRWLPRVFPPILRVTVTESLVATIRFWPFKWALMILDYSLERSAPDRALFYLKGGALVRLDGGRGRFEFRQTVDSKSILAAVHDFCPKLPWFFYQRTQARVHLVVMWFFGRHLKRLGKLDR